MCPIFLSVSEYMYGVVFTLRISSTAVSEETTTYFCYKQLEVLSYRLFWRWVVMIHPDRSTYLGVNFVRVVEVSSADSTAILKA